MVNWIETAAVDADLFQAYLSIAGMARACDETSARSTDACALPAQMKNRPGLTIQFFVSPALHRILRSDLMESASLGQLILTGVPGTELDPGTAALFRRVQPGGFIIFGRNIESAGQLRKLIDDLRDLSAIEPIITIDQEGGRVSRLRLIGNEPPNAQQLREQGDLELVRRHGDITGRLLRMFGFGILDLCPVLDISFDDEADNSLRGAVMGATSKRPFDWRARLIMRCGDRGWRAAENISPATRPPRSTPITTCR